MSDIDDLHDRLDDVEECLERERGLTDELAILWQDGDGNTYRDADHTEPLSPSTVEGADPLMIIGEAVVETDWRGDGDGS